MDFQVNSDIIEIKFSGDTIKPDAVSLEELSKEILLLNRLLKPIIEETLAVSKVPGEYLGLIDIGNRSLSFRYRIKDHIETTKKAFTILLVAIANNDITTLPARTIEALEKTSDFNAKHNCVTHFGVVEKGDFVSYGSFKDNFKAEKIGTIKGPTIAHGYLKQIGGDIPSARLVLNDRSEIKINLTLDQAREYSHFLYSFISVEGLATWKGVNLKLTSIEAQIVHAFEKLTPEEGFSFLRENLGKYYKDNDPNYFE